MTCQSQFKPKTKYCFISIISNLTPDESAPEESKVSNKITDTRKKRFKPVVGVARTMVQPRPLLTFDPSGACNVRNVLSHPPTTLPVIVAIQLASQWASYIDARGGARRMVLREEREEERR